MKIFKTAGKEKYIIRRPPGMHIDAVPLAQGYKESENWQVLPLLLCLALFFSFVFVLGSMLSLAFSSLLPIGIFGALLAVAEFFALRMKRVFLILNLIFAGVALVLLVFFFEPLGDGMKMICNQMFAMSEKYQYYAYDKFNTSDLLENYRFALAFFFAIIAFLCSVAVAKRSKVLTAIFFIAVVGAQVYYGVSPWSLGNVVFFTTIGFLVIYMSGAREDSCDKKTVKHLPLLRFYVLFLALIVLIFTVLMFLYSGANSKIHDVSERMRDEFALHVEERVTQAIADRRENNQSPDAQKAKKEAATDSEAMSSEKENIQLKEEKVQNNTAAATINEFQTEYNDSFSGAEAGMTTPRLPWVWLFVGIIVLASLIPLIRYFLKLRRAVKARGAFSGDDYAVAVDKMFMYLMEWLKAYGLKPGNCCFEEYKSQLQVMMPNSYNENYLAVVVIWQQAVYSDEEISEEQRNVTRDLLAMTKKIVWNNVKLGTKFKIKFSYLL